MDEHILIHLMWHERWLSAEGGPLILETATIQFDENTVLPAFPARPGGLAMICLNMKTVETKILLVDDHEMILKGLQQLLAVRPGLIVVGEAGSGQAALEQARLTLPDLVLMDVHLSGESGVDVSRRLLAEFPKLKIIALSGDSRLELVFQALHAGVSGYVLKQNGPEELFIAIHAVLASQLHLSPEIASVVIKDFMKRSPGRRSAGTAVNLSERERLLLQLVAGGKRNQEIGGEMDLTAKSVETYRSRLMKKLGCASTIELIRFAIREDIIQA